MKVIVAGDYCPRRSGPPFEKLDYKGLKDNSNLIKLLQNSDVSIVNFESSLAEITDRPILKDGPGLSASYQDLEALKEVGFNVITLANNHSRDFGDKSLMRTINSADSIGLKTVGAGANSKEAASILYIEKNCETIAIINCCEHEYSVSDHSGATTNGLNPIIQYYEILEAKRKADFIIMIIHGGHEHYQLPSPRMQTTYRYFIDLGVDAVINHHQHCFSGYETYKNKLIVYGLGNFYFPPRKFGNFPLWHNGYIVNIEFKKDEKINYSIIPYNQYQNGPGIEFYEKDNPVRNKIEELNKIILNKSILIQEHNKYMEASSKEVELTFNMFKNRYIRFLYRKRWLPSIFTERQLVKLLNYLRCESHLERSINYIENLVRPSQKE